MAALFQFRQRRETRTAASGPVRRQARGERTHRSFGECGFLIWTGKSCRLTRLAFKKVWIRFWNDVWSLR